MSDDRASFSISDRLKSIGHAMHGLRVAFASEKNLRIQFVFAAICIGLGFLCRVSPDDWRWIILSIGLVLAAELVNTAFEHLCDVVQPGPHHSVKAAKDIAAGAVLMTSMAAAGIGALIFLPRLVESAGAYLR